MIETNVAKVFYFRCLICQINCHLNVFPLSDKEIAIKKQLLNNYQTAINRLNRYQLKNLI